MRVGFGQPWAAVLASSLLLGGGALCQEQRLKQIRFLQVRQLAVSVTAPPVAAALDDHPVEVRASEYNLGYATRNLVSVMPKSAAVGHGGANIDLYIPGVDPPNIRVKRDRIEKRKVKGLGQVLSAQSLAAVFSDYDHSGHESLFLAGSKCLTIYHSDGRSFVDVTKKAGFQFAEALLCAGVTLGDLDGDGFPDLLVAAYTDLSRPPTKSAFTFPNDFSGIASRLYRNNRDGTFTEVTESAGLGNNPGRARKGIFADFDNDHRLDILLLRDEKPPVLYLNRGGWRFEDRTWDAGDDLTTHAFFEAFAMDFDHDGRVDLALWSTHSCRILFNQGNAVFERTAAKVIPDPRTSLFDFRGIVADLDGNGFEDVVTVDQKGQLRSFTNVAGKFTEVSLLLPPGSDRSYLQGAVEDSQGTRLLSRQLDGKIVLLQRDSTGSPIRPGH